MRKLIILAATCVVSGCARPDQGHTWLGGIAISAGPQPGYAIKRVIEKQNPLTLVGDDGSLCRTSRERFNRTKEGAWIACVWALPGLDSTEMAGLS